jgi:putative acetyltransferase
VLSEPRDSLTGRKDLPVDSVGPSRLIRPARLEDAEALQAVHEAAVSAVSAHYYPPEILNAWRDSISSLRMRSYMADPGLLFLVARHNGAAVGFGCLEGRQIRAVYVHPGHGRKGFGQALLQALEKAARKNGFKCVFLRASLNAAPFYLHNGYTDLGPGEFDLCAELNMPCRRMAKAV